jgi:flagellar hook-length control protein FliK
MNLNPGELGRLEIELTVKNGALTARIQAESRAAYEALGGQIEDLKRALAEGGVEIADLTLAHEDAESGRTLAAGLEELSALAESRAEEKRARARADRDYAGEVHRVV